MKSNKVQAFIIMSQIALAIIICLCNYRLDYTKRYPAFDLGQSSLESNKEIDTVVLRKRIPLGSEKAGVYISLVNVYFPDSIGSSRRLCINYQDRIKLIESLNDLKGLIKVTTPELALRVVRLRTSPATWRDWNGTKSEVEFVSDSDVPQLPNFGIANYAKLRANGMYGIFPKKVLDQGGFTPANVRQVQEGFIVTRWVFSAEWKNAKWINARVYQIRETLRADGQYKRAIIKTRGPSGIPNADWVLPITQ